MWTQIYDPLNSPWLSPLVASIPVVVLLAAIACGHVSSHRAALAGLASALAVAIWVYGMPAGAALASAALGAGTGLFPIGWIILNLMFLYQMTVERGHFESLKQSLARLAPDPRVQVILIAFCFGAFFEGAAGFGTPVAVTSAILIQLGFRPLQACGLSLIANTAPVAFGAMGTPVLTLAKVMELDDAGLHTLTAMVGRQLPFFALLIPFWVVCAFAGFRKTLAVWPAALTAGLGFALPQFLISNFHGPWLVDIGASLISLAAVALLLRFWQPGDVPRAAAQPPVPGAGHAWVPWIVLSLVVFLWGIPAVKTWLDGCLPGHAASPALPIQGLDQLIHRAPPVAPATAPPEAAVLKLNWLSATGTGILLAAILSGFLMGLRPAAMLRTYGQTLWRVRFSLLTIAAMLALGFVTRYSGADATLGLALARTGWFYPFFGTLLGWLGVALTGSDTASNVLFGGLQKITAQQLHLNPILMGAANTSGGVMGKMIDAQSLVVASTATNW